MKRIVSSLLFGLVVVALAACSDSKNTPRAGAPAPPPQAPTRAAGATSATAAPRVQANGSTRRAAQSFDPNSFQLQLEEVASGFRQPLFVAQPPDGSGRLFVVERGGMIRIIQDGHVLPQPFLDVSSLVIRSGQEQGLLGLAFHPNFAQNGIFFIDYTARTDDTKNTVARYHVSTDPNRADPNSAAILLAIPDFAPNHNGGMLAFGPDGYLYIGTGDGGGGGDPQRNGQNRNALLGKILRLDVDHGDPYAIPPDNPFTGQSDARAEVWAYGLRNPWRFSFDRGTGDLWIADVGQNDWEEIDLQPAADPGGEDYGWNIMEGRHCYSPRSGCNQSGLTPPVLEYDHGGGKCSITGGYVYRGTQQPALTGAYFFGDWCSGQIWSLHQATDGSWMQTELLDTGFENGLSSFGEDQNGELYVTDLNGGGIYRLVAAPR